MPTAPHDAKALHRPKTPVTPEVGMAGGKTEGKTKSKAVCSNQETACYLAQQITEWLCRFVCHQRDNETDDVAGATRNSRSSQIDLSPIPASVYIPSFSH